MLFDFGNLFGNVGKVWLTTLKKKNLREWGAKYLSPHFLRSLIKGTVKEKLKGV